MKRIAAVVAGAALVMVSATSASAQKGSLFLVGTGGAALPMGDFKDSGAKTGWMAAGGLGYNITNNLFVAGVYRFGSFGQEGGGDALKVSGPEGSLGWSFGGPESKMAPYVRGGFGKLKGKVGDGEAGDSQTNLSGAVGLYMPKGKGGWFVEGQYNTMNNDPSDVKSNFLVVSLGFTWTLWSRK
jgi:hypothetical protein